MRNEHPEARKVDPDARTRNRLNGNLSSGTFLVRESKSGQPRHVVLTD